MVENECYNYFEKLRYCIGLYGEKTYTDIVKETIKAKTDKDFNYVEILNQEAKKEDKPNKE